MADSRSRSRIFLSGIWIAETDGCSTIEPLGLLVRFALCFANVNPIAK